ncbi:MAG: hypothetical protein ACRENI_01190 [Gemmatimonadaceae bacterium]
MSGPRRGASRLGCLFTLLLLAAIGYFGIDVGEAYYRYFRYRDAMKQEVRFAGQHTDPEIVRRLRAVADSLDLPAEASRIGIRRTPPRHIDIWASYTESVDFPLHVRDFHFTPRAEGAF